MPVRLLGFFHVENIITPLSTLSASMASIVISSNIDVSILKNEVSNHCPLLSFEKYGLTLQ